VPSTSHVAPGEIRTYYRLPQKQGGKLGAMFDAYLPDR
jgi:hypothetical protein